MIPWSLVARYPHQHLHAAKFSAGITCHSTLLARIFSVFLSFFPETGPAVNPLSTAHALRKYTTSILHTEGEIKMNTNQKRTLTITCTEGNEVTKKQHACFVHNLIADLSKPNARSSFAIEHGVLSRIDINNSLHCNQFICQ